MGGLSCVAKKQEDEVGPEVAGGESSEYTLLKERRESQKPWNRNSTHIYCGERKNKPDEDKPPDDQDGATCDQDKDSNKTEESVLINGDVGGVSIKSDEIVSYEAAGRTENITNESSSDSDDTDNESKDSVPDIHGSDSPLRFNPPPHIAPFNPKYLRRPRSLDSAENFKPKSKSRPLSYSPGLLKTKHPRSLHCITEQVIAETKQRPRQRPQSMDMSAFFEVKGFDIHTQKLRRLLTQKTPKRSRAEKQQHFSNALLPLQPGQVKFLEEGPSRCFQPSQMLQRKRKNRELVVKEVNYLRKAMTRPRMKFSKSLDIFIKNCEQYMKYDPLHNEKAAQPSNPWISEDEVMWDINRRIVEIPTEMRIRMWALRFEALLQDATGCLEFEHFLKKEYSLENIRFYKACKELIVCPNSDVARWKAEIEREFLTPGAPCEVNIDCKTLEQVLKQLHSDNDVSCKSRFIFQPAMEHVYGLMKKDSYTRFIRSDQYKQLLEKSQTVFAKKRFFNFGSNRKKTTAPSPQVRRRGSVSSDGGIEAEIGGASYHSYSTGNLKELEDKPKHALRQTNSPSLRRRTENVESKLIGGMDPRRRSNLEVPRASYNATGTDASRKSEALAPCIALNVPRTNIVTPWEGDT
ncbi:uncharacterized protein LOC128207825 isoform X2 [Mya arenaria]|uniref:uncharacterized protein LOC128207825 isoform X2 n=1 Tax=Mya arenaria TaxID=6604 RepID=UPI0022E31001|nr:uncharacterized protein LOC128207825 isoform X2 [Mya arenaria]